MSSKKDITIELVSIKNPRNLNLILGQSHFIKTVEDLYEAIVTSVPGAKFGLAFSEASGERYIRVEGTSSDLMNLAAGNLIKIGCGHTFIIFLENLYPINILNSIKNISEVVRIFCATANSVQVVVGRSEQGGGVMGVIDGQTPLKIETDKDKTKRHDFLRKIGYKK